ncbi:MAG: diacylglycerol/lipid kinase family protein, partial [Mucilaginibacter sp.]
MKFKHIHFIVNPASGKEEPILFYINRAMNEKNIKWDISVTKKGTGAGEIAKKISSKTDLIVVYGGDGCVTEVASALHGSGTPMAIIPGGTANVMAKELGIPLETTAAIEMIATGHCKIKKTDMGLMNGYPFLLRINLGIMADMVLQASRSLKDDLGQLAY